MNMLSCPVAVTNYLNSLVTTRDQEKMDNVSLACFMNKADQSNAKDLKRRKPNNLRPSKLSLGGSLYSKRNFNFWMSTLLLERLWNHIETPLKSPTGTSSIPRTLVASGDVVPSLEAQEFPQASENT
ncbi:hypothetical protein HAX54_031526 [Datura stramonium]|uniref:Rho-GAP domain-containing protein n=1 Tax=Datura stramonium TaxID=4076 RepID=A0ABS8RGP3_DATST|nr:hypothetical protein [Datura stramonium]